ncbi:hypothetical protein CF327_g1188 [Tilletia walkeri]|nr:hypothetical protein CF327_g1188 [Tilletia walkeri]
MKKGRNSGGPSWQTADDIPMDDQDEFLANRDKITFGNDSLQSRAQAQHQQIEDEDNAAQEVFRLHQVDYDDDDELEDDDDDDDDMEDAPPLPSRSQKKKTTKKAVAAATSDPESESDTDSDASTSDRAHFGRSKRAYYASKDALDSASEAGGSDGATTDEENELSPEQRRQMELREVRKMATASRKGMVERDFGLEDELELAAAAAGSSASGMDRKTVEQRARERRRAALLGEEAGHDGASGSTTMAQLQNVHVALPTDPETVAAMLRDLHAKDALTLALAGEFADSVHEWNVLEQGMEKAAAELPQDHPSFSLMHIYQQTFLTYLTTLTFYFYLRTSPAYSPSPSNPTAASATLQKLRQHPVIARLTELKEALANMEDLGFRVDQADSSEADDDELAPVFRGEDGDSTFDLGDLEDGELDDLLADEKENQALTVLEDLPSVLPEPIAPRPKSKKAKKSAAQNAGPVVRGPLAELDDLVSSTSPVASSSTKRKTTSKSALNDAEAAEALGELTSLSAAEKAEKQSRKRSLRFYAGQIASRDPYAPSSSAMAAQSKASALSGDADIPYTDRDRSRRAVEAAAEAKRARANGFVAGGDVSLEGNEAWGEADDKAWRDVMGPEGGSRPGQLAMDSMDLDGEGGDAGEGEGDEAAEYYDLVATAKKNKKKTKQDTYDEARLEERYQPDETLGEGEHRSLNRTIEKNRGLTPHRPKTVRNPRVKKRLKYESAKKKLSSSRPVYKGGQSSLEGAYGGEKSGISEGIVRSRSFS